MRSAVVEGGRMVGEVVATGGRPAPSGAHDERKVHPCGGLSAR